MTRRDALRELMAEAKLLADEREAREAVRALIKHALPAPPHSLAALEAVVATGALLGAVVYSDSTGRPCVGIDNVFVAYVERERDEGNDIIETVDPFIDELLVELAEALGCRWAWTGATDANPMPTAITLTIAPAFVAAERELEGRR
jgi:hypothetical protein